MIKHAATCFLLAISFSAFGEIPTPTHADLAYGTDPLQKLDLWIADSAEPTPLIIWFHSGTFGGGDKADADGYEQTILAGLESGVSFAAANFRLITDGVLGSDILMDGARAVQFLRGNATLYNLDPKRFGAFGNVYGGSMAIWLGVHADLADPKSDDVFLKQSSKLSVVGSFQGQATFNISRWPELIGPHPNGETGLDNEIEKFLGPELAQDPTGEAANAIWEDLDYMAMLSRKSPPIFQYNSRSKDAATRNGQYVRHPTHAVRLAEAADQAKVTNEIYLEADNPDLGGQKQDLLMAFFYRHLNASRPPEITSNVSATPKPGRIGKVVTFSVAAMDPEGGELTYTWNFGDGTEGTGATVDHTYMAEGSFTATVTITDESGKSVTGQTSLNVRELRDQDNDGYPDDLETAFGSDPNSNSDTPLGLPAVTAPETLTLLKLLIRLKFSATGNDQIKLKGILPVPDGFSPAGKTVVIFVGGVVKTLILDEKGASPKGSDDKYKMRIKSKKGVVAAQDSMFTATFKKGDFAAAFADEGLTSTDVKKGTRAVEIMVLFEGQLYRITQGVSYTARTGKVGSAKMLKP